MSHQSINHMMYSSVKTKTCNSGLTETSISILTENRLMEVFHTQMIHMLPKLLLIKKRDGCTEMSTQSLSQLTFNSKIINRKVLWLTPPTQLTTQTTLMPQKLLLTLMLKQRDSGNQTLSLMSQITAEKIPE